MYIVVALSLFLSLSACNSKSDAQKSADDANRSVEQAKKDADKAADDAKKAAADAANAAKQGNESALDATAPGGQPGAVALSGALVREDNTIDTRVTVTLLAGKSWRSQRPQVNSGVQQLKAKLSDQSVQEIEKLKTDKTFVNLGCDTSVRPDVNALEERIADSSNSSVAVIKAKVVLICDASLLKANMTLITADTVVLSGVKLGLTGAVEKSLSIVSGDLSIESENQISSKGQDGASTILQGPSISIASSNLIGNGKLEIISEGASYKGDAK